MIEKFIKWLAKIFALSLEPPFEIVDNLDVFVKDRLSSMLGLNCPPKVEPPLVQYITWYNGHHQRNKSEA